MPTYEYRCESCKRRYERRESFSAPTSHACERCKKGTAKRILHAPTVVFKGSGFYVNDSKRGSSDSSSKTISTPSDTSSSKSSKSSKSDSSSTTSSASSD